MSVRIQTKHGNAAALRRRVKAHEEVGGLWFAPSTMAFFDSRVETGLLPNDRFVSSEQFHPYDGESEPRRYTVRAFAAGDVFLVSTVGEFQQHDTLEAALAAAAACDEREQA